MCEHGNTTQVRIAESAIVVVDSCIVQVVQALNASGLRTVASCCGHGHRPGNIALADGRELIIAPDHATARQVDAAFPNIHGEPRDQEGLSHEEAHADHPRGSTPVRRPRSVRGSCEGMDGSRQAPRLAPEDAGRGPADDAGSSSGARPYDRVAEQATARGRCRYCGRVLGSTTVIPCFVCDLREAYLDAAALAEGKRERIPVPHNEGDTDG